MTQLAVNYSRQLDPLVESGAVPLDLYKIPAWPRLFEEARRCRPVYVHFPLLTAYQLDNAYNSETKQPADWDEIERMADQTNTPFINLHLYPATARYNVSANTSDPAVIDAVLTDTRRSLEAAIKRFGAERVILENVPAANGGVLEIALDPEMVHRIVTEHNIGLLLDISHARLAAEHLNIDPKDYINRLPVERIREIHVTGIQTVKVEWVQMLEAGGFTHSKLHQFIGKRMDHLSFVDEDWEFFDWSLDQIKAGRWAKPEIIAFEYGGVEGFWELVGQPDILAEQVPRLYQMVHTLN